MDIYPYRQDALPESFYAAVGRIAVAAATLEDVVLRLYTALLNKHEDDVLEQIAGEHGSRLVTMCMEAVSESPLSVIVEGSTATWLEDVKGHLETWGWQLTIQQLAGPARRRQSAASRHRGLHPTRG